MPWNNRNTGPRRRVEDNPQMGDVWAVLRSIESRLGGLTSEVANVALSVNRADARNENVSDEMRRIGTRLDTVADRFAQIAGDLAQVIKTGEYDSA